MPFAARKPIVFFVFPGDHRQHDRKGQTGWFFNVVIMDELRKCIVQLCFPVRSGRWFADHHKRNRRKNYVDRLWWQIKHCNLDPMILSHKTVANHFSFSRNRGMYLHNFRKSLFWKTSLRSSVGHLEVSEISQKYSRQARQARQEALPAWDSAARQTDGIRSIWKVAWRHTPSSRYCAEAMKQVHETFKMALISSL